jgi:hypothetical protein
MIAMRDASKSLFMSGFFEELKRRKVYRVAAAYIIAAGFVSPVTLSTRTRARDRTLRAQSRSRSFSTARQFFAAKLRNSAKRRVNQFTQDQL